MYVQNDGQVVKVLDNGNGTYDIVVRDLGNPSGAPTAVIKDASSNYVENQINSGRWH
jgi:hypothetical protein